jgi:hypothetical protein
MNNNMKNFLNQKIEVTRGDWLILAGCSLLQSGMVITELVKDHKERTTGIGVAKRKWQVAEDECALYRRKLKKIYGRKVDLNKIDRYVRLREESEIAFKAWMLMDLAEKIGKLGDKESKKKAKLERLKKHIEEQY